MSESETSSEHAVNLDPLVGKVLCGRFVLDRLISRGGMGKVYRATQKPLDRTVALKILDVAGNDGEFRRRFFMEASHCAKLTHPHTVRIYDYGATDDGIFFIAMEHLQGRTLHDMLHTDAPIDPLRAMVILRRMCGALAEAHDAGIVHRDLKPANVFLVHHGDDPEFPKVIDFGLVKELGTESELSRTGHVLGSPMYMSPEQVEAKAVDGRTDIYAAGLILYFMLCGQTAFPRGNPMVVLMAQVQRTPKTFNEVDPSLEVPAIAEWIVRRCIEKDPNDRFANMHELLRALKVCEKVLRGELASPVDLELVDGRVVIPDGLDISEELRLSSVPRATSVPPPTPLGSKAGLAPKHPPDTTLLGAEKVPPEDSRTSVGLMVAGGAVSAAAVVGGIAMILTGIGVLAWAFSGSGTPEPTAAPQPAPLVVQQVEVQLTSEPAGAEVEQDGVFLGTTPHTFKLDGDGKPFTVTVKSAGHQPRSVRVAPDQSSVHVPLTALPTAEEPAPEPAPPVVQPRPAPAKPAPAPAPVAAPAAPEPAPPTRPQPRTDLRDPWAD